MRISFIHPKSSFPPEGEGTVSPGVGRIWQPTDQAFMAAMLRNEGVECQIVDAAALNLSLSRIRKEVEQFKPDMAVITSTFIDLWRSAPLGYDNMTAVVKALPPHLKTVIYGPHVSGFPEKLFKEIRPTYAIVGEPEERVTTLVLKGHEHVEDGILYEESGSVVARLPAKKKVDMAKLPVPAYDLLPMDAYHCDFTFTGLMEPRFAYTIASRGCPYQCTFCYKEVVSNIYRPRPLDIMQAEFEELKRQRVKSIYFGDEVFTMRRERVKEICEILKNYSFHWGCQTRSDLILNLENIRAMKQAGCSLVDLGLETFDDNILKNIKKGFTNAQTRQAIAMMKEEGLPYRLNQILGLPGETQETATASAEEYRFHTNSSGAFPIATLYPQTELWRQAIAEGKIKGDSWQELGTASGTVGNTLGGKKVRQMHQAQVGNAVNYRNMLRYESKLKLAKGAIKKPRMAGRILARILRDAAAAT